jgi:hypothetical protein
MTGHIIEVQKPTLEIECAATDFCLVDILISAYPFG